MMEDTLMSTYPSEGLKTQGVARMEGDPRQDAALAMVSDDHYPHVPAAFDRLVNSIDQLEKASMALDERTQNVRSPRPEPGGLERPADPRNVAALAGALHQRIDTIDTITDRLNRILAELEL